MNFSQATPSAPSVSAAWRMVSQSDWLPMMMAIGAGMSLILRNRIQKSGPDYRIRPLLGKAGVPALPFVSRRGEFVYEWQNQRDTSRSDRKSTRLNSSHSQISYAVFCL